MKSLLRVAASVSLSCCAFAATHAAAAAPAYPTKPITLVVGYTAGGSVDLVARTVAPELGKRLGQSVVIENLGGAGGTIGAQKVVKAEADGYTLLMGSGSEVSIARLTNPAVRYDGEKDLAPITFVGTQPMVLVGKLQLPAKDAGELMALAKAKPGTLSYASSGVGTPLNLAGELIKQQGKVNITHVPYKGASAMATDLLGGQIDLMITDTSTGVPQVKSGKLRALGYSTTQRSPQLPEVPTLEEAGVKGYDMGYWFAAYAPAGTPEAVVARLNRLLSDAVHSAGAKSFFDMSGSQGWTATPQELAAFQAAETQKWGQVIKAAGIQPE